MTQFVMRKTGLEFDAARALQHQYLHEHGTTLAGLMAHHGVDPHDFLNEVHDVSLDAVVPDAALTAGLERLPGKRLVFTNGDTPHAVRILDRLGIADLFDGTFALDHADWVPKPNLTTFHRMMDTFGVIPSKAVFFEDSAKNLAPARTLGMTTVLVGPHARDHPADFIDYRTLSLPPFLLAAEV